MTAFRFENGVGVVRDRKRSHGALRGHSRAGLRMPRHREARDVEGAHEP